MDFDLNVKATIFASNGMNEPQHLILYPGDTSFKTGQALNVKPMKHFILDEEGGMDFISVDPHYSIQAQLFQPYAHENQNNKTEYKAGAMTQPLEWDSTLGAWNVNCEGNTPVLSATKVQGQKNHVFLFNIASLSNTWKLRIVIFLSGTFLLEQWMTSKTKRYEVFLPQKYKLALVEANSDNLSVESNQLDSPKWICLSETITVCSGQVVAVALKDEGTQVSLKAYSAVKLTALNQPNTPSSSVDFSAN